MRTVTCRCGEVQMAVEGEPFMAGACHCDDCQAGSRQLEAEPGAPKVLGPGEGSEYVLIRRDHLRVETGAENLKAHTLKPDSKTRRVITTCCATPMYVDVAPAHWITAFREPFQPGAPLEMRVNVQFAPQGSLPDDGIPHHGRNVLPFVARIAIRTAPMLLSRKPRLRWPPKNAPA